MLGNAFKELTARINHKIAVSIATGGGRGALLTGGGCYNSALDAVITYEHRQGQRQRQLCVLKTAEVAFITRNKTYVEGAQNIVLAVTIPS